MRSASLSDIFVQDEAIDDVHRPFDETGALDAGRSASYRVASESDR